MCAQELSPGGLVTQLSFEDFLLILGGGRLWTWKVSSSRSAVMEPWSVWDPLLYSSRLQTHSGVFSLR